MKQETRDALLCGIAALIIYCVWVSVKRSESQGRADWLERRNGELLDIIESQWQTVDLALKLDLEMCKRTGK